ncbi:hypothetical protein QJS10_CPB12g01263 [Acorus calamus]|uniref:Uncharacterized protein n=1 Tax=Acorus calamus TaxID=4465 RepID=A0AAV9DNA2_ACOCL|nr:hypothetical protein QJS10_CPB12g01263 [Acorus calamus]
MPTPSDDPTQRKQGIKVFSSTQELLKQHKKTKKERKQNKQAKADAETMILREKEARQIYATLLNEEESFIRQKSRQNNIQLGDSNSAYFYASVAARKARNTLRKVRLQNGEFTEDPTMVKEESIAYYRKLLNKESGLPIPPIPFLKSLSTSDNLALNAPIPHQSTNYSRMVNGPLRTDGHPLIFRYGKT